MPGAQVLQRQVDPTLQGAIQTNQNIQDSIYKKQAAKMAISELQLKAKNSKNAAEKEVLTRKAAAAQYVSDQIAKGQPAGPVLKIAANVWGAENVFGGLGEAGKSAEDFYKQLNPSAETQSAAASANLKNAQADRLNAMDNGMGGGGGVGSNDFVTTSLNSQGLPIRESPSGKAAVAKQETLGREQGKFEALAAPIRASYEGFSSMLDDAVANRIDIGLGDSAAAAYIQGGLTSMIAETGKIPEVQAFKRVSDLTALQLASFFNRGRPSEVDAKAAKIALTSILYPEATNRLLDKFMRIALSTPDLLSPTVTPENQLSRFGGAVATFNEKVIAIDMKLVKFMKDRGESDQDIEAALEERHSKIDVNEFIKAPDLNAISKYNKASFGSNVRTNIRSAVMGGGR